MARAAYTLSIFHLRQGKRKENRSACELVGISKTHPRVMSSGSVCSERILITRGSESSRQTPPSVGYIVEAVRLYRARKFMTERREIRINQRWLPLESDRRSLPAGGTAPARCKGYAMYCIVAESLPPLGKHALRLAGSKFIARVTIVGW